MDITLLKQKYHRTLIRAQQRFRYYKKTNTNFLPYQEALRTGGQFSFADINTESEFLTELARIRQFYNLEANYEGLQLEIENRINEEYRRIFDRGTNKSERNEMLDLGDDDQKMLYRVYRRTIEEDPYLLMSSDIYDSADYLTSLYRGIKEGMSEDDLMFRGHKILTNLRSMRQNWDTSIPISSFNSLKGREF